MKIFALTALLVTMSSSPMPDWQLLGSGDDHACVIDASGSLACLGGDAFQTTQDLASGNPQLHWVAPTIKNLPPLKAVSGGTRTTCGLDRGGEVWCWGSSALGALGNGMTASRTMLTAQRLALPAPANQISSGYGGGCALLQTGGVSCWGTIGRNNSMRERFRVAPFAERMNLPAAASDLSVGVHHGCAVLRDGAAYCWGFNRSGALGDGSKRTRLQSVRVAGSHRWVTIAPGYLHTCAIDVQGWAWCWGANYTAHLGRGQETETDSLVPGRVAGLPRVRALASGSGHSCAIDLVGGVWCWGENVWGAAGQDASVSKLVVRAQRVDLPGPARTIAAAARGSCALLDRGAWCWGELGWGLQWKQGRGRPQMLVLDNKKRD